MKYVFLYDGHEWVLVIDTFEKLEDYLKWIWILREDQLKKDQINMARNQHPSSDIMTTCHILAGLKGTTVMEEFLILKQNQRKDMEELLRKESSLYVNPAGGYSSCLAETKNRYESDTMEWPVFNEADIRIKQWPGGTHYYAYIGPVQVKEFDVVKWDTEEDARAAAMHYVTKRRESKCYG